MSTVITTAKTIMVICKVTIPTAITITLIITVVVSSDWLASLNMRNINIAVIGCKRRIISSNPGTVEATELVTSDDEVLRLKQP